MKHTVIWVSFSPSLDHERESGLIGWAQVALDSGIVIDGIAVRRNRDGHRRAFLPERKARDGRLYPFVRFASRRTERDIEKAVLRELDERGVVA